MAALAGLLHQAGCRVTGSDGRLYPPTSTILERIGLEVHEGFDPARLRPAPDLVVVGNAISRGNLEVEETLDRDLPYTSMPRLISERFLQAAHSIVVAGTHGKTTTASMLAWVLTNAGRDPGFLIGGAPLNFDLPFHLGRGGAFVIEGDEYDTAFFDKGPKFMHYRPDTILLGTVEFDHADIYRDLDDVKTAFRRLVNLVPRRGLVVRHEESPVAREVSSAALCRVEGYGFDAGAWRVEAFEETPRGTRFRVLHEEQRFATFEIGLVGRYNVRNAMAVAAAAHEQGLEPKRIASALASFRGVRRRLELRGEAGGVKVLDDFAHHPTAIAETLQAVRRRFPDGRVWAVLEPRSWSLRHNVFHDPLRHALEAASEVVIAPVYRADAVPESRVLDVQRLARDLETHGTRARCLPDVESIVSAVAGESECGDVIVVMSNGGFGQIHDRRMRALRAREAVPGAP